MKTEDVEKIVELSKKVSEQEQQISSYQNQINDYVQEIEKQKADIVRLQKIISDNFVATKEKPKSEMATPKSFNDIYRQLIENNQKQN